MTTFKNTKLYKSAIRMFDIEEIQNIMDEYAQEERENEYRKLTHFSNLTQESYDLCKSGGLLGGARTVVKEIIKLGMCTGLDMRDGENSWMSYMNYLMRNVNEMQ